MRGKESNKAVVERITKEPEALKLTISAMHEQQEVSENNSHNGGALRVVKGEHGELLDHDSNEKWDLVKESMDEEGRIVRVTSKRGDAIEWFPKGADGCGKMESEVPRRQDIVADVRGFDIQIEKLVDFDEEAGNERLRETCEGETREDEKLAEMGEEVEN